MESSLSKRLAGAAEYSRPESLTNRAVALIQELELDRRSREGNDFLESGDHDLQADFLLRAAEEAGEQCEGVDGVERCMKHWEVFYLFCSRSPEGVFGLDIKAAENALGIWTYLQFGDLGKMLFCIDEEREAYAELERTSVESPERQHIEKNLHNWQALADQYYRAVSSAG